MLVNKGHHVFLLTLSGRGFIHDYVSRLGVSASASPVEGGADYKNILRNAFYLIRFCKKNSIHLVLAHQQSAALPLIFSLPFIHVKSYYIRHNSDEDYKSFPRKAYLLNRFINKLIPSIIAPSDIVYRFMTGREGVPSKKIQRINYGYNFLQYDQPDIPNVKQIGSIRTWNNFNQATSTPFYFIPFYVIPTRSIYSYSKKKAFHLKKIISTYLIPIFINLSFSFD
jgi:hypothetical protein